MSSLSFAFSPRFLSFALGNTGPCCYCGTTRHYTDEQIVSVSMHSICDEVIEHVSAWPGVKHQHTLLSDISAVGSLNSLHGVVVIAYGVHTRHGVSSICDGVNLNDRGQGRM